MTVSMLVTGKKLAPWSDSVLDNIVRRMDQSSSQLVAGAVVAKAEFLRHTYLGGYKALLAVAANEVTLHLVDFSERFKSGRLSLYDLSDRQKEALFFAGGVYALGVGGQRIGRVQIQVSSKWSAPEPERTKVVFSITKNDLDRVKNRG